MSERMEKIEYVERFCDNCVRPFVTTKNSVQILCIDCEGNRLLDNTIKVQADELDRLRSDLAATRAELEALRAEKKQYRDRAIALRNQARAWRDTVYKTVLLD